MRPQAPQPQPNPLEYQKPVVAGHIDRKGKIIPHTGKHELSSDDETWIDPQGRILRGGFHNETMNAHLGINDPEPIMGYQAKQKAFDLGWIAVHDKDYHGSPWSDETDPNQEMYDESWAFWAEMSQNASKDALRTLYMMTKNNSDYDYVSHPGVKINGKEHMFVKRMQRNYEADWEGMLKFIANMYHRAVEVHQKNNAANLEKVKASRMNER